MYGVALAVYLHPRRVDQEGHVVVHHLYNGVGRLPAVFLEMGVVDPDLPLPGLAPPREVPVGECRPISVYRGTVLQVSRVDPPVVLAGELFDQRCLILRHLLPDSGYDLVQKLVFHQHRYASLGGSLLPGKSIIVRRSFPVRVMKRDSPARRAGRGRPRSGPSVLRSYWTRVGMVTRIPSTRYKTIFGE